MTEENTQPTLQEKIQRWRDMTTELAPFLSMFTELEQLEEAIKEEIRETGEIPDVIGVHIIYRNGYPKTRWNTDALKGYAVANPDILQFMEVFRTKPSVSLRLNLQGDQP